MELKRKENGKMEKDKNGLIMKKLRRKPIRNFANVKRQERRNISSEVA